MWKFKQNCEKTPDPKIETWSLEKNIEILFTKSIQYLKQLEFPETSQFRGIFLRMLLQSISAKLINEPGHSKC